MSSARRPATREAPAGWIDADEQDLPEVPPTSDDIVAERLGGFGSPLELLESDLGRRVSLDLNAIARSDPAYAFKLASAVAAIMVEQGLVPDPRDPRFAQAISSQVAEYVMGIEEALPSNDQLDAQLSTPSEASEHEIEALARIARLGEMIVLLYGLPRFTWAAVAAQTHERAATRGTRAQCRAHRLEAAALWAYAERIAPVPSHAHGVLHCAISTGRRTSSPRRRTTSRATRSPGRASDDDPSHVRGCPWLSRRRKAKGSSVSTRLERAA